MFAYLPILNTSIFTRIVLFVLLRTQLDDANVDLDRERSAVSSLEKKQKKFDAMLGEEKGEKERLASERENIERESRNKETKVKIGNFGK